MAPPRGLCTRCSRPRLPTGAAPGAFRCLFPGRLTQPPPPANSLLLVLLSPVPSAPQRRPSVLFVPCLTPLGPTGRDEATETWPPVVPGLCVVGRLPLDDLRRKGPGEGAGNGRGREWVTQKIGDAPLGDTRRGQHRGGHGPRHRPPPHPERWALGKAPAEAGLPRPVKGVGQVRAGWGGGGGAGRPGPRAAGTRGPSLRAPFRLPAGCPACRTPESADQFRLPGPVPAKGLSAGRNLFDGQKHGTASPPPPARAPRAPLQQVLSRWRPLADMGHPPAWAPPVRSRLLLGRTPRMPHGRFCTSRAEPHSGANPVAGPGVREAQG